MLFFKNDTGTSGHPYVKKNESPVKPNANSVWLHTSAHVNLLV